MREFCELYPSLKEYAMVHGTPIILPDSLMLIKELIQEKRITKILEIGTAIGYSALHMASVSSDIKIDTIERNLEMISLASENFKMFDKDHQINQCVGDALEYPLDKLQTSYDLIFIDAAKAQSQKFFEKYVSLLNKEGIIITDNMNFHGVDKNDPAISKNLRHMLEKIEKYHNWLVNNLTFETEFLDLGDGLALTRRKI